MNYINNSALGSCCGLGASDKIEIEESTFMIDCETGETLNLFSTWFVAGKTYRCEKRWALRQSFNLLKTFDTREAAQLAYDELVRKLAVSNTVIDV